MKTLYVVLDTRTCSPIVIFDKKYMAKKFCYEKNQLEECGYYFIYKETPLKQNEKDDD